MASSRKPPSVDVVAAAEKFRLHGKRIAVALSGGVDSVVLLHVLSEQDLPLEAIHVHHGLSANAEAWVAFCRKLCKRRGVPLTVRRVVVRKRGKGLEAAAREARYQVFRELDCDALLLAHHLDDQAETVLMSLLRGAGPRGARGMSARGRLGGKTLLRPLLDVPRAAIVAYARKHRLAWIDDEANADESLTRNFVRRRLGPLIETRFPRWREALARAARHFSGRELSANALLRDFLQRRGLRAPSAAKLVEMLKQLTSGGARTLIDHDGARLRVYRGKVIQQANSPAPAFAPLRWKGEPRLAIPELGGELRFRRARGKGIDLKNKSLLVRLRSGGERLQPDPRRPRRTLKNLFQEAGVPPWERERLPLLVCGDDLVWVPGLGVDARYQASKNAPGVLPEWRKMAG